MKTIAHEEEDFAAHVFQHETDHQQGILFVDKVEDPGSYMMADEYRRRILGQENKTIVVLGAAGATGQEVVSAL